MTCPSYWREAKDYLAASDKTMGDLIALYPNETMINYHNPFYTLVKAIIGQQISVKAANAISQRLESCLKIVSAKNYLAIDETTLRECGLSRQKINYITNIAKAFEENILTPSAWLNMSDEDVFHQLTSIKGVGVWTAQMFLIFHLHRPDIFPVADLGLVKAIQQYYGQSKLLTKTEIIELSQQWKPYRTVATWFLWRSLDPLPVQY